MVDVGYIAPVQRSQYMQYQERLGLTTTMPLQVYAVEKKQRINKHYKRLSYGQQLPTNRIRKSNQSFSEHLGQLIDRKF